MKPRNPEKVCSESSDGGGKELLGHQNCISPDVYELGQKKTPMISHEGFSHFSVSRN